jgi:hypothetical protein
MFPGENPIDKRVQTERDGAWFTVVGIASNVKNAEPTGEDNPEFYMLRRNSAEDWNRTVMVLETALLGFFAFTGPLIAVIGLYGVTAFMVTQRTQEVGVPYRVVRPVDQSIGYPEPDCLGWSAADRFGRDTWIGCRARCFPSAPALARMIRLSLWGLRCW